MASDSFTLDRLRNSLTSRNVTWIEKKMFGGYCFMVDDKMCLGTNKDGIMFRVDPNESTQLTQVPGITVMEMGGRVMVGYLQAAPSAYDRDEDLAFWVDKCLAYNPMAKSSKKK